MIICADDDWETKGNPGLTKAAATARSVGAKIALPDFGSNRPKGATDFNDMALLSGLEAVRRTIEKDSAPVDKQTIPRNAWPEPLPLSVKFDTESYPLDARPDTLRAAVEEVQDFTKAPVPLVASSALATVSLAIQSHIDVKRAEKLTGPVGLFLLTIADSGE